MPSNFISAIRLLAIAVLITLSSLKWGGRDSRPPMCQVGKIIRAHYATIVGDFQAAYVISAPGRPEKSRW